MEPAALFKINSGEAREHNVTREGTVVVEAVTGVMRAQDVSYSSNFTFVALEVPFLFCCRSQLYLLFSFCPAKHHTSKWCYKNKKYGLTVTTIQPELFLCDSEREHVTFNIAVIKSSFLDKVFTLSQDHH